MVSIHAWSNLLLNEARVGGQERQLGSIKDLLLLFDFVLQLKQAFSIECNEPEVLPWHTFSCLLYVDLFSVNRFFHVFHLLKNLVQSVLEIILQSMAGLLDVSFDSLIVELVTALLLVLQLFDSLAETVGLASLLFSFSIKVLG